MNNSERTTVGPLQVFVCNSSSSSSGSHAATTQQQQQPRSRTVDLFSAFCSLSLTPSSVWGQSPAEGQMVSFPPTGAVSIVYCNAVSFSTASFPRRSSSSYGTVGIQFTIHLHFCCAILVILYVDKCEGKDTSIYLIYEQQEVAAGRSGTYIN